jgi:hypothetical protein
VILDYNEKNQVVGIEMLFLSKRTPNLNTTALEFESVSHRRNFSSHPGLSLNLLTAIFARAAKAGLRPD